MPTSPQADPIHIFYPNGGTSAVQVYVWDTLLHQPVLWDGSVAFSGTISIGSVSGSLTNNNAAPAANNLGVLPAVVSTTSLGYTQGNQALLRVDTTGALVVSATLSTTGLATSAAQTDGSQKTQVVNTTGNTQAFGAGTTTTTTVRVVLPTDQTAIPITGTVTSTISGTVSVVSTTLATNTGAPNLATAQVTVSTTATLIAAARATRRSITIIANSTTASYLGTSTVSTTTGVLLIGTTGAAFTMYITGSVSGITASGSQVLSYEEEYD